MVATVVSLTSASSTVHYFCREGHGLGTPANDDEAGEDYYARRDDERRKASRWRGGAHEHRQCLWSREEPTPRGDRRRAPPIEN